MRRGWGGCGAEAAGKVNGRKICGGWKGREAEAKFWAEAAFSNCKYRNQLYLVSLLTPVRLCLSLVRLACCSLHSHRSVFARRGACKNNLTLQKSRITSELAKAGAVWSYWVWVWGEQVGFHYLLHFCYTVLCFVQHYVLHFSMKVLYKSN